MATNTEMINKIATSVAVIESTVGRLDRAINGNGKPGLLDRVTVIENRHCNEDLDECEAKEKKDKEDKAIKEKKDSISAKIWAVILIFISAVIVQSIGLVILFIRTGGIK